MSSNRRRGRSSESPATGAPAAAVDSAPEVVADEEASQDASKEAYQDASRPVAPVEAATETAVIPEVSAETSPETLQAAVMESVTEATEQAADTVETIRDEAAATVVEATEAATEQASDAVEHAAETVEAAPVEFVEQSAATVEQVAETAMTLAAAPLAVAEVGDSHLGGDESSATSFAGTAGVRFTFIPTFEPLNEINATLLAFARGEGEAAVAHLQALTMAKSPAEAIRLQVSEFQRAADASLTCFGHILRSANRLGGPARWN